MPDIFPHPFVCNKDEIIVYRAQLRDGSRIDWHPTIGYRVNQTSLDLSLMRNTTEQRVQEFSTHINCWYAPTAYISTTRNPIWLMYHIALQIAIDPERIYIIHPIKIRLLRGSPISPDGRIREGTGGVGIIAADFLAGRSGAWTKRAHDPGRKADEVLVHGCIPSHLVGPAYMISSQYIGPGINLDSKFFKEGQAQGPPGTWIQRWCATPNPITQENYSFDAFTMAYDKRRASIVIAKVRPRWVENRQKRTAADVVDDAAEDMLSLSLGS